MPPAICGGCERGTLVFNERLILKYLNMIYCKHAWFNRYVFLHTYVIICIYTYVQICTDMVLPPSNPVYAVSHMWVAWPDTFIQGVGVTPCIQPTCCQYALTMTTRRGGCCRDVSYGHSPQRQQATVGGLWKPMFKAESYIWACLKISIQILSWFNHLK